MLITIYDSYQVLQKVYRDKAYINDAFNSTPIEELNKNLTHKICYGVLDKDLYYQYYISRLSSKSPKSVVKIILKISMFLIDLGKSPYAVVDSAVELMKKLGKGGMGGFVNAVLRKYITNKPSIDKTGDELLSIKYSYPLFAVKMLKKDYGDITKILEYDENNTYIRFNNEDGEKYLLDRNKEFEKTEFLNLFRVNKFKMEEGFNEGKYTFQSIGSVALCSLLVNNLEKKDNLLDACAAPGGKSVYLADYFQNVISCDIHEHRVELIKKYALRMGKNNITPMLLDGTINKKEFNDKFDVVLVDSPCSGFGVLKDNPDIKLNRSLENVLELIDIQKKILENVSKYVKVGGYLCYSTCSIFKDENEKQMEWFLSNNINFEYVEEDSPLNHLKCKYGLQFLPYMSKGAGFYFCKLKRVK